MDFLSRNVPAGFFHARILDARAIIDIIHDMKTQAYPEKSPGQRIPNSIGECARKRSPGIRKFAESLKPELELMELFDPFRGSNYEADIEDFYEKWMRPKEKKETERLQKLAEKKGVSLRVYLFKTAVEEFHKKYPPQVLDDMFGRGWKRKHRKYEKELMRRLQPLWGTKDEPKAWDFFKRWTRPTDTEEKILKKIADELGMSVREIIFKAALDNLDPTAEREGWDCADTKEQPQGGKQDIEPDRPLSVEKIANRFNLNQETLRKRLERLRKKDHDCFIEVNDHAKNEPKFLYKMGKVQAVIDAMKSSAKRPSKKISH